MLVVKTDKKFTPLLGRNRLSIIRPNWQTLLLSNDLNTVNQINSKTPITISQNVKSMQSTSHNGKSMQSTSQNAMSTQQLSENAKSTQLSNGYQNSEGKIILLQLKSNFPNTYCV